jgi:hypothetical protein
LENASGSQTSHSATHCAYTHNVETYIYLDSSIDNAIMHEEAEPIDDNDSPTGITEGNNDLFAYMVGQQSSSGDIIECWPLNEHLTSKENGKSMKVHLPRPP